MRKVYVLIEKDIDTYRGIVAIYSSRKKAEKAREYLINKYFYLNYEIVTQIIL